MPSAKIKPPPLLLLLELLPQFLLPLLLLPLLLLPRPVPPPPTLLVLLLLLLVVVVLLSLLLLQHQEMSVKPNTFEPNKSYLFFSCESILKLRSVFDNKQLYICSLHKPEGGLTRVGIHGCTRCFCDIILFDGHLLVRLFT